MAVLRASNAPIGLNKGKPNRASNSSQSKIWERPSDWLTFTAPSANEQKVIGNVAIFNQDSNYIALVATVSAGTYTVDWGDGTSTTHTSNTQAEKNYTWSSISSDTLTSRGYRQAIVTITPTTSGATFSSIGINRRHSAMPISAIASNTWLDVAVAAPNATAIAFSYLTNGAFNANLNLCERVNIVSHNMTNMTFLFREMRQLQSVPLFNTAAVTNMSSMFNSCSSLESVPLFNTAAVTLMASMFSGCYSLESVPLFNTAAVTNMNAMFNVCSSLESVPLFNTAAVTNMSSMFNACYSLQDVPLFNTAAVTNMNFMFNACYSLQSVPLFNTAAVTNMSTTFSNCTSLQSIPLFNTAAVTTMASMFNDCTSLKSVPLFNTASVTNMSGMFDGCSSLESVPLFNTAAVTNMSSMFNVCVSLQDVPLFNTAAVTTMAGMFNDCYSLQNVPLFNTQAVTTMSTMFNGCFSLQTLPVFNTAAVVNMNAMFQVCFSLQDVPELNLSAISSSSNNILILGNSSVSNAAVNLGKAKLTGNRWTQTFQNCKLGTAELNEMYTALAVLNPSVTNVTATGTAVTYTVDDIRAFVTGRTVTFTGITPAAYNLTNAVVATVTAGAGTTGTFTVANTATGTYVSGGVAALQDNRLITVTGNPGVATDDPTIATNKGWQVTG